MKVSWPVVEFLGDIRGGGASEHDESGALAP